MNGRVALAGLAARRSQTYWLLSRLFAEPPAPGFVAELERAFGASSPAPGQPLAAELGAAAAALGAAKAADPELVTLAVEFTRLFGGLSPERGLPPPFESVLREGKLLGDATLAVSAAYADAGMADVYPEAGPVDHLATELRFMSLIAWREHEAWHADAPAAAARWLGHEAAFLDQHLLGWLPEYVELVAREAHEPFYAAVARLAAAACRLDRDDVRALLELAAMPAPA